MSRRNDTWNTIRRAALLALVCASLATAGPAQAGRFAEEDAREGPASWVALESPYLVHGDATAFSVSPLHGTSTAPRLPAARPIRDGALHAGRLFLATPDGIEVRAASAPGAVLDVLPLPGGVDRDAPLRIAFVVDLLVLGHDGGLVVFEPPMAHRHHGGEHRRIDRRPEILGRLATAAPVRALAGDGAAVWVAAGAQLLRVDLSDAAEPAVERAIELPRPAGAVAADGERLYWTDAEGLHAATATGADRQGPFRLPGAPASKIALAGRDLHVATGAKGVRRVVDGSARAAIIGVSISNFAFSPSVVNAIQGDTVRWQNLSGTHNVEACDGVSDPGQCSGTAVETFNSGAPTSIAFVFSHTFTQAGTNPYFCAVHAGFGMTGVVNVEGVAAPPPTVPDGTPGDPLRVGKLDGTGSALELSWDADTCTDQADHHVIWGFGADLPATPGGPFAVAGAECTTGADGAFVWNASPDPAADPLRLLWFLPVAGDGGTTEGGWGLDSSGTQRGTAAADGNSGRCGIDTKDLGSSCGR